ncbi:MAG: DUF2339 domain-containing protein, partial [Verrucomicrobiaceae bacterium]
MDGPIILLLLFAFWLLIGPVMAIIKATEAKREAQQAKDALQDTLARISNLENELHRLKSGPAILPERRQPETGPVPTPAENPVHTPAPDAIHKQATDEPRRVEAAEKIAVPPPLPLPIERKKSIDHGEPAIAVPIPQEPPSLPEPAEPEEPFSLEKFMGVKLFAWLGGVAMFFGVIFFVKYAFENNLISPATRITLGFVTGSALLIGGLVTHRLPRYKVLAQAFCATGVLILYGVSFAAHAIYHFPAFGTISTFILMAVITFAAFLIAVRLNALVVAVLGMLGGFITPVLLSTGEDQVLGLFGYIALLDAGLLALSRHGRWRFLTPCAAAGTALMQIGWFNKFFVPGNYDQGSLTLVPMGILLGFIALFLGGGWIRRRRPNLQAAGSVVGLAAVAVLFAFVMLWHRPVAERYFLLHGFLLMVHLAVIAAVIARPALGNAQVITAVLGFIHLGCWTTSYLNNDNLYGTLATYLVFGVVHAVVPALLFRRMPTAIAATPLRAGPWFGPLALAMMALPFLNLQPVPMVVWAAILLANLLVIGIAVATRAVVSVLVALLLTMVLAAMSLDERPSTTDALMPFLGVVTGFSALFAMAGKWLSRNAREDEAGPNRFVASHLPTASGVMPFLLLLLALDQLPVPNPSAVFGVALLMAALLAVLAITGRQGKLLLVALGGTF